MLILGISTSTKQVGAAVGGHEGVLASSHSARGKRHAENLAPAIDFVRRQARIELDEISAVAVDIGPGLFTGLRVGVAAANAVAHALRVPMIGISSLDLLAWPLRHTSREIVAVIDARSAWATARAAAMPTRRPVNSPGPMSTATAEISSSSTRACRRTKSIDGARFSAWRLPRAECDEARTPSWPPMAAPTCLVDVEIPRMST
jgi:tRNA threonylcarbamoyl adenosine modification protein YeaZ